MGGGDLNLKKSWHPQTIRNVEKVWKAEQKAEAEAKKIEQLRKELDEERAREDMQRHAVEQGIAKKKGERLDWMYAAAGAGHVDHELYLLGKPVDKAVDPMVQDKDEDSSLPGASFMNDTGANSVNDLAAKVRDDPLFLIKKKEDEKRKELINNPVKMKQLKLMLQANLQKSSKKKKKDRKKKSKEKKEKKKKRKQRHSDSSERSESEEEEMLKENQRRKHVEREKEAFHGSHRNHHRDYQRSSEKRRDDRRSRSRSASSRRDRERWEDRQHRHNSSDKHRSHSPSYSSARKSRKQTSPTRNKSWNDRGSAVTRTMDAAEKEKRLAAMMENVKWRDDQRGKNIKRYKEEDEKLEARDTGDGETSAKFLTDVKIQSFSSKSTSSVSDRIRRNIHSVQRTPAALESFLAKR